LSHFEIYEAVGKGIRPHLSKNTPEGFNQLLNEAWQQNASDRPSSRSIVTSLEIILSAVQNDLHSKHISTSHICSPLHEITRKEFELQQQKRENTSIELTQLTKKIHSSEV
jgi:hypothetical protein